MSSKLHVEKFRHHSTAPLRHAACGMRHASNMQVNCSSTHDAFKKALSESACDIASGTAGICSVMLGSLRTTTPIERSFFRITRFAMRAAAFWPTQRRSCATNMWFAVTLAVVTFGGVNGVVYGFVHLDNFVSALEAFCPAVTMLLSSYKLVTFVTHHRRFVRLVNALYAMLTADSRADKRRLIQGFSAWANTFSFLVLASGQTTNTCFNVRPPLVDAYRAWWLGVAPKRLLPFNVILPEVLFDYPYYPGTYALLTLSGLMTVMAFSGADGFFLSTCYYFASLFYELQFDIRELFADLQRCEFATAQQSRRHRQRLGELVSRHNCIMELCDEFTALIRAIVFLHFISAALVMCLSILDLMLNANSVGMVIYVSYSVAAGSQYLLYCAGGSKVQDSSAEVADTLYNIAWYKCDLSTRKMILIMLHRSQRAKTVDVPFFSPSLPSFNSLITKTGSYITLLKTFF